MDTNTIIFSLHFGDQEQQVQTRPGEYYSLMGLISDYLSIPGFGLCCGMGSCETCLVEIDGDSTLSCATPVNDELANTKISVDTRRF